MRQTISAIAAAIVVTAASAVPAMACGGGGCHYVSPCAQDYVAVPEYSPYYSCTGWGFERMPDPLRRSYPGPVHQYYYVDQGPTYDGPGEFAPYRTYRQSALGYHHPVVYSYREHHWRPSGYYYGHHHVHHMHCCTVVTDRPIDGAHRLPRAAREWALVGVAFQPIRPSRLAPT